MNIVNSAIKKAKDFILKPSYKYSTPYNLFDEIAKMLEKDFVAESKERYKIGFGDGGFIFTLSSYKNEYDVLYFLFKKNEYTLSDEIEEELGKSHIIYAIEEINYLLSEKYKNPPKFELDKDLIFLIKYGDYYAMSGFVKFVI